MKLNTSLRSFVPAFVSATLFALLSGGTVLAASSPEIPGTESFGTESWSSESLIGDPQETDDTSVSSSTQPTTKLEDDASAWTVSILGSASWNKANVTDPTVDGKALRLTMSNATIDSEISALRDTGARSSVGAYTFATAFQLRDNQALGSPVQDEFALGFVRSDSGNTARAFLKWIPLDTKGNGMWYVYDPNMADQWRSLNVRATYLTGTYYTLSFDANVSCTMVQYKKLILNGTSYTFSTSAGIIPSPNEVNRVQASATLSANSAADGFVLYLDNMSLTSKSTKTVICTP